MMETQPVKITLSRRQLHSLVALIVRTLPELPIAPCSMFVSGERYGDRNGSSPICPDFDLLGVAAFSALLRSQSRFLELGDGAIG